MNDIYDSEFHPLIHPPYYHTRWFRCLKILYYLVSIVLLISFTVVDLVFGYSSSTCNDQTYLDMPIPITDWLIVSGYMGCLIIVFAIIFGCFIHLPREAHLILNMIPQIMMISWLLVGHVIYWKDYYGNNRCSTHITNYVITRLILGIVLVISSVYHEIKSLD